MLVTLIFRLTNELLTSIFNISILKLVYETPYPNSKYGRIFFDSKYL